MNDRFNIFNRFLAMGLLLTALLNACNNPIEKKAAASPSPISEAEVIAFQKGFGISLNNIANVYQKKGDYKTEAKNHIEKYYGLDEGKVLVKHVDSNDEKIRMTYEGILSYLIADNPSYPDDEGFALQSWTNMNWKNYGIINDDNIAIAIGQSKYLDEKEREQIKNYTMCLKKYAGDKVKLIGYHSSFNCDN